MKVRKEFLLLGRRRKLSLVQLFLLLCVLCSGELALASDRVSEYVIAAKPTWVASVEAGSTNEALLGQIRDGVYHLLSDSQTRLSSESTIAYRHFVTKAINAKGLESVANIEISFDPSYQSLVLHSIDVIREGRVIHKLADAQVRILQRETELEFRVYDGSKTANVFLDDVRVGDSVDYAYSVSGRNPVFKDVISGATTLQYSVPVGRIYARLLLPIAHRVTISPRNTALQPTIDEREGYRNYLWDIRDVPALTIDPNAPSWYDPYGVVQWGEYADWAAVGEWAKPLYQVPAKLSPELQAEVDRIAQSEKNPAGRMLAALRFVQSEIRYLGVEIGPGSHAPNQPSLVFSRRFGDCKDKALLLISMLDRLGIESHVALVNTRLRRGIADIRPSPSAFDHVLVQAKIDGQLYWIDPTRGSQRGDLAHIYQPDYGFALIVNSDVRALTSMKTAISASSKRNLHAVFDVREGFDKPVHFKVVSAVDGEAAESLRSMLASSNFDDLQKQYLNYYARYYPSIASKAPLKVADDTTNNRITTTESYDIADFAILSSENKRHTAEIGVPDIDDLLRGPPSAIRKAPLRLEYPSDVTQITEVLLPDEWPIKESATKIEDSAFVYERTIEYAERRIVFTDRYRSLVDEISAQDTARYAANLARAREVAGYQLYWTDQSGRSSARGLERFNWLIALLGAFALAGWIWLALVAYRYDPPAKKIAAKSSLQGIRGWLLLPAFGAVLTPFVIARTLIQDAEGMATDTWAALTTYGSTLYHVLWAPSLLFEFVANLGLLVFSILLAILFFQRRRSTPFFYLVFLIAALTIQIVDHAFVYWLPVTSSNDEKAISEIVRSAFSAMIWGAYFLSSERVKSTFVMDLVKKAPATTAATASTA